MGFKPNGSVSTYHPSTASPLRPSPPSPTPFGPSCSWVSLESALPGASYGGSLLQFSLSDADPLQDNIVLPTGFVSALLKAISPKEFVTGLCLVVADTSATDHMVPDRSDFISYKAVRNLRVRMGNNSFAPVLGWGTAIILLNGQRILIHHVLHVPALHGPPYSLRAHLRQRGCGFVGSHDTGMHFYFPGVVLIVDTSTDCHLTYKPLNKSAPLSTLHYFQHRCPPTTYPDENAVFCTTTDSPAPVLVKNDDGLVVVESVSPRMGVPPVLESPSFKSIIPKQGSAPKVIPFLADDIASISQHLKILSYCLSGIADSPSPSSAPPEVEPMAPKLLLSLSPDEVVHLVHRPGSLPPPVCPCNWSNGSDTKTHWTLEELHRALGCRHFRNYRHITQTSLNGECVNGGEFPLSIGSYMTILKAPRGGSIDHKNLS